MSVKPIHDEGQTLNVPTGKVLGILDAPSSPASLGQALAAAGFGGVQTISGEEGVRLLERIHTFFFSDMEDRVLKRHIEELKAGHTIVVIETPMERRDEAVQLATEHGVRRIVHFGQMTVTWLTT